MATTTQAEVVGEAVGAAMARDVLRNDMPREWAGIDPQDADQFAAAGLAFGSDEWHAAEAAAEAEYLRVIGDAN